jgi:hypothetical protein
MTEPKLQAWLCEVCGSRGCVEYEEHADVFTVLNAIGNDHGRYSEGCQKENGTGWIRVQNEAWVVGR